MRLTETPLSESFACTNARTNGGHIEDAGGREESKTEYSQFSSMTADLSYHQNVSVIVT